MSANRVKTYPTSGAVGVFRIQSNQWLGDVDFPVGGCGTQQECMALIWCFALCPIDCIPAQQESGRTNVCQMFQVDVFDGLCGGMRRSACIGQRTRKR